MPSTEDERIARKICPKCGTVNKEEYSHCKKCSWPLEIKVRKDD